MDSARPLDGEAARHPLRIAPHNRPL